MSEYDEWLDGLAPAVGVVPVEGRGSLPFVLMHGESLVATATWALAEAEVVILDFTETWDSLRSRDTALVVHDPLCAGTPVGFLAEAVRLARAEDVVVVGVRPVTDTVRTVAGDELGDTVDRDELQAVTSPLVLPSWVVAALPDWPVTDDLADLVATLAQQAPVHYLEAPAAGRRMADASEVALVEALADEPPRE